MEVDGGWLLEARPTWGEPGKKGRRGRQYRQAGVTGIAGCCLSLWVSPWGDSAHRGYLANSRGIVSCYHSGRRCYWLLVSRDPGSC